MKKLKKLSNVDRGWWASKLLLLFHGTVNDEVPGASSRKMGNR